MLEDNAADAELIKAELRRSGPRAEFEVVATRGAYLAALDRLPDIIISDVNVPQFGGREALELLGESGLDIPLVIVSGAIGEEAAVDLVKLGAVDYILKDRLARLPQALERAVHAAGSRREKKNTAETLRLTTVKTADILRRQHEQYRHLFEKNPSPMWVFRR